MGRTGDKAHCAACSAPSSCLCGSAPFVPSLRRGLPPDLCSQLLNTECGALGRAVSLLRHCKTPVPADQIETPDLSTESRSCPAPAVRHLPFLCPSQQTCRGLACVALGCCLSGRCLQAPLWACPTDSVWPAPRPPLPRRFSGKESACQAGNTGSIPGLGRAPEGGDDNPLQYSCLGNPMDRRAWRATVHGVTGNQTQLCD